MLAYTERDQEELKELAQRNQTLAMETVLPPESIRTVATPSEWKEGTKLWFSTRVRPTSRGKWEEKERTTERDIYLERKDTGMNRAELYCHWTGEMMEKQGGACPVPDTLAMTRFQIRRVRRQRNSRYCQGPDVTVTGALEVRDPGKFRKLLSRGIGRHRAYGYGNGALRPVQ